ncbi:hypothetical protein V5O48_018823, partial [Marasmius crinis-equi]
EVSSSLSSRGVVKAGGADIGGGESEWMEEALEELDEDLEDLDVDELDDDDVLRSSSSLLSEFLQF